MADNFSGWDKVAQGMEALGGRVTGNAKILMEAAVGRTANEAKRAAPWHDRTGDARRSIHGEVHETADGIIGAVGMGGAGLEYTEVLELGFAGRYRVIDPTVFGFGKTEMQLALKDLMK